MKRTIIPLIVVLLVCVVAVGFYRGWFSFSSRPDAGSNKVNLSLTLDTDKVKADAKAVNETSVEFTRPAQPPVQPVVQPDTKETVPAGQDER